MRKGVLKILIQTCARRIKFCFVFQCIYLIQVMGKVFNVNTRQKKFSEFTENVKYVVLLCEISY